MKRVLTAIIALAMISTTSISASAAGIDQDSGNKSSPLSLTYTVLPTYTVIIPETVTLGQATTISAENVVIDEGKQVNVKLTGTSGASNAFTVENEKGTELTYAITKGNADIHLNDSVLSVNSADGTTGLAELLFSTPADIRFPGTYTGTVTFTISVDSAN